MAKRSRGEVRLRAVVGVVLPGAGETLFKRCCGLSLLSGPWCPPVGELVHTSVAFVGESARGMLHLWVPTSLATAAPIGNASATDWAGELANELLGRLTRRLTARGHVFSIGTPRVDTTRGHLVASPTNDALTWSFSNASCTAWVMLEAQAAEWFAVGEGLPGAAVEGELLMFPD
jgi:hypothetical protein